MMLWVLGPTAPLEYTVSDMWRMVWEYRVRVILMTTTLTEDGNEVNPPIICLSCIS